MATDLSVATVTESFFSVNNVGAFTGDFAAHRAIQEWVKKHGIDPAQVHATGPIYRDEEHCRVVYVGRHALLKNVWTTCVQQGETPPLPWPPELERYRG
jgi:hypothetical protein